MPLWDIYFMNNYYRDYLMQCERDGTSPLTEDQWAIEVRHFDGILPRPDYTPNFWWILWSKIKKQRGDS